MASRSSAASEFTLIDAFVAAFPKGRALLGPGDDCALWPPSKTPLCITTDAVVEGVHFTRKTFSLEDVGHKALAVNLSDLAAMGATPAFFVCAVAAPRGLTVANVRAMARGMSKLARGVGIELVGGNFTRARELSLTLTVAGEVPASVALRRSGGRAGDVLYVSGTLGEAALGLAKLRKGETRGAAVARQRRPMPRLELGRMARGFASAGIDLSDGLIQDLGHLARASGVAARIDVPSLPVSPALRCWMATSPRAKRYPLDGGEDYELLLAVPAGRAEAFERACRAQKHAIHRVGELVFGSGVTLAGGPAGRRASGGFDHFG